MATGHDEGSPRRQDAGAAAAIDRAVQTERARFATKIDLELRLACRGEAHTRREVGDAAKELLARKSYDRFGFVRLRDYTRERLGVSARTVQDAAWLAKRLDALPSIARAYDRSDISWSQARAICRVAVAADEERWLALARTTTVARLEKLVARAATPEGVPPEPAGDPNEIDGEPAVRWRLACPARLRVPWRWCLELASRVAGESLPDWRAAEIIAAEGSSGRPTGASLGDRALLAAMRLAHRARRKVRDVIHTGPDSADDPAAGADDFDFPTGSPASVDTGALADASIDDASVAGAGTPFALESPVPSDPFAYDARLLDAMGVLRTIEPRIGRLLRVVVDQRLYRFFHYRRLEDYVRERLGIGPGKAWALLKIEKATLRSDDFAAAYREGRLSWVRALTLLPVLDRTNAAAWIERANTVTVRRLADEVDWVLAHRDALGADATLAPPPLDSRLEPPSIAIPAAERRDSSPAARLQTCAQRAASAAAEVCDAEVGFTGPASVVALFRDVLDAFADPAEPRWTALERLLRHVITHWESTPRHPDPVFARDGWRCTVPACSSRRNLHDHHIRFRSRGGDNRRDNRTVVCAAHHLHGIHAGTITARGTAPGAIEWRLGVRPGAPPLLAFVGDRYRPLDAAAPHRPP